MGDLSPDVNVKLGRLVAMLSSPVPGEVVATAAAIGRTLDRAGMDWHDLAKRLTATAQPQPHRGTAGADFDARNASLRAMADWLAKYAPHGLTDAQHDFVANMQRTLATGRQLSPAQTNYLRDLHRKHGGRA